MLQNPFESALVLNPKYPFDMMELQSACNLAAFSRTRSCTNLFLSRRTVSTSIARFGYRRAQYQCSTQSHPTTEIVVHPPSSDKGVDFDAWKKEFPVVPLSELDLMESVRGKSGSVSFKGLTHQSVEESKLESTPFRNEGGSLLWILAPVALIASFVVPPLFLPYSIYGASKLKYVAELMESIISELIFYVGLTIFFRVTIHVQRPYLQFSPKRWGLITGLKGYIYSYFFTTGLKVLIPIIMVCATWPALGLASVVSVTPFLIGCVAQFMFQVFLDNDNFASCWPLIPIIFELYRMYQLSKAIYFLNKIFIATKATATVAAAAANFEVLDINNALIHLLAAFQGLGMVSLWSLLTFLMRLFPSRPVNSQY